MPGKRTSEARRWYQQSVYDLQAATWNLKGCFFNTVCFLSQQSSEKALKALLYYQGSRRKALLSHSLNEMVLEIGKTLPSLMDLLEPARNLDLHYIPSRYPNGLPGGYPHQFYSRKTAEQGLRDAEKIGSAVTAYFNSQGAEEIIRPDE
jgi:HEPN domain-containing protein